MRVVTNIAERNAIPAADRTAGDVVYINDQRTAFILHGGITNAHWRLSEWCTTADMEIYVDPAGDDDAGLGTSGSPYATITRAYADVPYKLRHPVQIHIGAGTYTSFPTIIKHECEETGQLIFDGEDGFSDDEGTLTAGTVTKINDTFGYTTLATIQVAGASWTTNEHAGKFTFNTSGTANGRVCYIRENTADTLTLYVRLNTLPESADTFTIGLPRAVVNVSNGCFIKVDDNNAGNYGTVRIGLGLIDFNFSSIGFHIKDTNCNISSCSITATGDPSIRADHCAINEYTKDFADAASTYTVSTITGAAFDFRELFSFETQELRLQGCHVEGAKSRSTEISTSDIWGALMNRIYYCSCTKISIGNSQSASMTFCTVKSATNQDSLSFIDSPYIAVDYSYLEGGQNMVRVYNAINVSLRDLTTVPANYTKYGIDINNGSVYKLNAAMSGDLGGTYFYQTDSIFPDPPNGASVTDGQGSIVTSERV
jgi:hypothetical protein